VSPPSLTYLPTICRRSIRISSTLHEHSSTLSTSSSEAINPPTLCTVPVPAPLLLTVLTPLHNVPSPLPRTLITDGGRLLPPLPTQGLLPPPTVPSPHRNRQPRTLEPCLTPGTAPRPYSVGIPTLATVRQPGVPIRSTPGARPHLTADTPARPRSTTTEGT